MTQAYLSIPYHWNKPTFRHQTLNIFCQHSLLWILVWPFTKQFLLRAIRQRIAAKYRKATDRPSESTQIIQTAEHGVTAPLIPRSGMRRQWFLAHPPPNGEPKWSESEVKAPLWPRLCPRGGGVGDFKWLVHNNSAIFSFHYSPMFSSPIQQKYWERKNSSISYPPSFLPGFPFSYLNSVNDSSS